MTINASRIADALASRYRIEQELGSGGMAVVYLAEDLKHRRKVAIKVLRPALAAILGAERFLKEIEVTANLQHAHILQLYDSGAADSFLFYVMPYVEGESLRDRLNREKQLGVEVAITIAQNVAAALDYAHRHGVIHRDIKPENILIHDGQAVVADFGIALAISSAGGTRLTETGLSLGTPEYMSPEQATGESELTPSSDVYSLGAVTYEMLAGEPPHKGATVQAIIARVVSTPPDPVVTKRPSVPRHVDAAVQKALAKVPGDRFSSAPQFAEAMTNVAFALAPGEATELALHVRRWKQLALTLVGLTAALLLLSVFLLNRPPAARTAAWTNLDLTRYLGSGFQQPFDLSSDGSAVVFIGPPVPGQNDRFGRLTIRRFDEPVARDLGVLTTAPHFSHDSRHIAALLGENGVLWTMPSGGGSVTTLIERGAFADAVWGSDGFIYGQTGGAFGPSGLVRIPERGGGLEFLTTVDTANGEFHHKFAEVVDGGLLFTSWWRDSSRIMAYSFETQMITRLAAGSTPRYFRGGYLIFGTLDGRLRVQRFDPVRLDVIGVPTDIIDDVEVLPGGRVQFDVADNGTLIYAPQWEREPSTLVLVDSVGDERPLAFGPDDYGSPSLSPDGNQVAYSRSVTGGTEIWVRDSDGRRWLVGSGGGNYFPTWSPDGSELIFSSNRVRPWELYRANANGSGNVEALLERPSGTHPVRWARDGNILFWAIPGTALIVNQNGLGEVRAAVPGCDRGCAVADLSPDGRYITYRDGEVLWVAELEDPITNRAQITSDFVTLWMPQWSPDGRQVYYVAKDGQLMAATVERGARLAVDVPSPLYGVFDRGFRFQGSTNPVFDVDPRGRGLVFVREGSVPPPLRVVFNFDEVVRTRFNN